MIALLLLSACLLDTYPDYWPEEAPSPTVSDVHIISTSSTDIELTITGTQLQTTKTVVLASRNATITQTSANSVHVTLTTELLSDEPWSLGLATENGALWIEDAFVF